MEKPKLSPQFITARSKFGNAKTGVILAMAELRAYIPVTGEGAIIRGHMDEITKQLTSMQDLLHGKKRSDTYKRSDRADDKNAIFTPVK